MSDLAIHCLNYCPLDWSRSPEIQHSANSAHLFIASQRHLRFGSEPNRARESVAYRFIPDDAASLKAAVLSQPVPFPLQKCQVGANDFHQSLPGIAANVQESRIRRPPSVLPRPEMVG